MKSISICIGRKGSKGLPGKNKMIIKNNPLCFYPMKAANNSKYITHSFLNTDDPDLQKIGNKLNHKMLNRPPELASSGALGEDVFANSYKQILSSYPNLKDHFIVLLFCNAPTVNSKTIDEAIDLLHQDTNADSVVSVSRFNMYSPLRARKLDEGNDYLLPFVPFETFGDPKNLNCDRDSQGDVYFANMSLSVVRPKCLLEISKGLLPQKWMGRNIKPIFQEFGCDIDYEWQIPLLERWIEKNQ